MLSPDVLNTARDLFPYTASGRLYMNHAGTSPISTAVRIAMENHLLDRSTGSIETYPGDLEVIKRLKTNLATLINAESPDRISIQGNTSDALNLVASGLTWRSGDRVIVNDLEFPANVYPFINLKRLGVEIDVVQSTRGMVTPEMVMDRCTPRTRLVALSAVQFLTGHRSDLATIGTLCRERGIIFLVDAIQAVGAVRIDVQAMEIDGLAAGAQKWQTGPHGMGLLYVSEQLQERIHQQYLGWLGVMNPWDFRKFDQPLAPSARRYEGGSMNFPGIHGYDAAISTLLSFGTDAIEGQVLHLTGLLQQGLCSLPGVTCLTPEQPADRAGIVTIQLPSGVDDACFLSSMQSRQIITASREGKIRFSPHFYNTPAEMERAVEATRACIGGQ